MDRTIKKVEEVYLKKEVTDVNPGDYIKINIKVTEGEKSRLQTYEGVVLSIRGEGLGKTIKVRKISYGIGVERTFPIHSPIIESITVVKKGAPRRAKLFYLRDRIGKRALKVKTSKKKPLKAKSILADNQSQEKIVSQVEAVENNSAKENQETSVENKVVEKKSTKK